MTTSKGKEIEEIDRAHISCFLYKLITSSKDSDDISMGFHRVFKNPERYLTNGKET